MKISIITVCFNNLENLKATLDSIHAQDLLPFEVIVVDGGSKDGTPEYLSTLNRTYVKWISGPDHGPYDAMNKGVKLATGDGLYFLNSGDYFSGQVLKYIKKIPSLVTVKYMRFGMLTTVESKSHKLGMPYNHQGIIFENLKMSYSLDFKIAADYLYYLQHGYEQLSMNPSEGFVYYDNFGMSSKLSYARDHEIAEIIGSKFGAGWKLFFTIKAWSKRLVKKLINSVS